MPSGFLGEKAEPGATSVWVCLFCDDGPATGRMDSKLVLSDVKRPVVVEVSAEVKRRQFLTFESRLSSSGSLNGNAVAASAVALPSLRRMCRSASTAHALRPCSWALSWCRCSMWRLSSSNDAVLDWSRPKATESFRALSV